MSYDSSSPGCQRSARPAMTRRTFSPYRMRREHIDGIPVARFPRKISPRNWAITKSVEHESGGAHFHVELAPRKTNATGAPHLVQIQVEREDGRVEGVCSFASGNHWTYRRKVGLEPGESLPSLVILEFIPQRLLWLRRRARIRVRTPAAKP